MQTQCSQETQASRQKNSCPWRSMRGETGRQTRRACGPGRKHSDPATVQRRIRLWLETWGHRCRNMWCPSSAALSTVQEFRCQWRWSSCTWTEWKALHVLTKTEIFPTDSKTNLTVSRWYTGDLETENRTLSAKPTIAKNPNPNPWCLYRSSSRQVCHLHLHRRTTSDQRSSWRDHNVFENELLQRRLEELEVLRSAKTHSNSSRTLLLKHTDRKNLG